MQLTTITSSGVAEHVDGWAISEAEDVRKPEMPPRRGGRRRVRRRGGVLDGGGEPAVHSTHGFVDLFDLVL